MKIMVSACLLGENVKYNGGNNRNEKVLALAADPANEIIPICPEVWGGLPVPRIPAEIRSGVVTNREGKSVDAEFRAGAGKALELALKEKPDLVILQSRSPSCGIGTIYDGSFTGTRVSGNGIAAQMLIDHGFNVIDVEKLG